MADIKTLIIRLYQSISNCADQSSCAAMQEAIDAIDAQAQTIANLETGLKARNKRIETLLILKDGYYDANACVADIGRGRHYDHRCTGPSQV